MTDFNNILKDKLEQFEVPYNDAHWAEMEGKLNKAKRSARIEKGLFIAAGIATILSISGYFSLQEDKLTVAENKEITTTEKQSKVSKLEKTEETNLGTSEPITQNNSGQNTIVKDNKVDPKINQETSFETEPKNQESSQELILSEEDNNYDKIENFDTDFIVFNGNTCLGGEVSFEAVERRNGVSYLWDFGDGNTSKQSNPSHKYKESGEYDVLLTITDLRTQKEYQKQIDNVVNIYPNPEAGFDWSEIALKHDDNKLKYPYTEFKIQVDNANQYDWNFGNGSTSKERNPRVIFKTEGYYQITLTTKNEFECSSTMTKKVQIQKSIALNAPNAFKPKSERIANSTFIPRALLGWEVDFELFITNKFGDLVYKTTDRNAPWNGRFNNTGNILEQGTYLWEVIVYDNEGRPHNYKERVILLNE